MSRIFARGRKVPHEYDPPIVSGADGLHEAKLKAWAILAGVYRPSSEPAYRRRIHRGLLNDLPEPEPQIRAPWPSFRALAAGIGRALGLGRRANAEAVSLAGASDAPVGETDPMTYIDPGIAGESEPGAPEVASLNKPLARAA
jgi:hypothetical protein